MTGAGPRSVSAWEAIRTKRMIRDCEYRLSFGYPADPAATTAPPRPGGRRPLAGLVHEERR